MDESGYIPNNSSRLPLMPTRQVFAVSPFWKVKKQVREPGQAWLSSAKFLKIFEHRPGFGQQLCLAIPGVKYRRAK
jgi:hypothetical protein